MRRENGVLIFENLVSTEETIIGGSEQAPIKAVDTPFTASNASAGTREVKNYEEVAAIATEMGSSFAKAFAQ